MDFGEEGVGAAFEAAEVLVELFDFGGDDEGAGSGEFALIGLGGVVGGGTAAGGEEEEGEREEGEGIAHGVLWGEGGLRKGALGGKRVAEGEQQLGLGGGSMGRGRGGASEDELADFGVRGFEEGLGGTEGDDFAFVKHGDAVSDAKGALHVVADDDGGEVKLFVGFFDHVVDVADHDGVLAGGGFVVDHNLGAGDDGAGESDALALSGGDGVGHEGGEGGEFKAIEDFVDAGVDLGAVDVWASAFNERKCNVFADGHGVKEGRALEEHTDLGADIAHLVGGEFGHIDAVEDNLARVWLK